jgi:hypothetical protein
MAIARSQMYRQLYGIGNLVKREEYGVGSKLKKFVRNIIPNEISEIAVKAAPFVAPFNPLLAAGMAGIGGFDKTGRIGSSLKSAALTYGAGQLGRYVGGAGFQEGINPFAGYNPAGSYGGVGSLFSSPIGTETGLQLGQFTDAGKSAINQMEPFGGSSTAGTLSKTPGTFDQLKTIFDPTSGADFGTRARAVVDLTGDAIKAMYTNKDGSLDKYGLDGSNQWPTEPDKFETIMRKWFEAMENLSEILLKAIAKSLNWNSEFFAPHFDSNHTSLMRLNHYPICPDPEGLF